MPDPSGASRRRGLGLFSVAERIGDARFRQETGPWFEDSGRKLLHTAIQRLCLGEPMGRCRGGTLLSAGTRIRASGYPSGAHSTFAAILNSPCVLSIDYECCEAEERRIEGLSGLPAIRFGSRLPHFPSPIVASVILAQNKHAKIPDLGALSPTNTTASSARNRKKALCRTKRASFI